MRYFPDWLNAFQEYASIGEAPPKMAFWVGVSAIAGALQRKVWIDQKQFQWYPNFYIILVAPPGIVSKSTTAGLAMNLLRQVPGIKFGPSVVTWQALVTSFAESAEMFEYQGAHHTMCPITLESSEFGNLLNPKDPQMVDLLVELWDGKQGEFKKQTKGSGTDSVINPWINLVACTTPSWIAGNFPEYAIGGGFTSRCIFVYAQEKHKYVAYPKTHARTDHDEIAAKLIADLGHIAKLVGEYEITADALSWGTQWYERHYKNRPVGLDDARFGGYIARKQTHVHKLAMVLSASQGGSLQVTAEHLATAEFLVTDLEADMPKVFGRIGQSAESLQVERFLEFIQRAGSVEYSLAYRFIHAHFPGLRDFESILAGVVKAGFVSMSQGLNEVGQPEIRIRWLGV